MIKTICAGLLLSTAMTVAASSESDPIFKAMSDELSRTMARLELKEHPKPYYVSYMVREHTTHTLAASFGAITEQNQTHTRNLTADVRIGDYKHDSSSNMGGSSFHLDFGSLAGDSSSLSVDDNYDAIRRELWLETDSAYKQAIEKLKASETYLKQNTVEDKPDSFSRETPVVKIEPLQHLDFDLEKWLADLRSLSAVFKNYANVRSSKTDLVAAGENRWFINSEGFRHRIGEIGYILHLSAQCVAGDGMKVADEEIFPAWKQSELPAREELEKSARAMAERLAQVAAAPVVANYRGPVLFEGQAGAEFFHQLLDSKLSAGNGGILKLSGGNDMHEKIGERLLPKFLSVVDDPKAVEFKGQKLYGTYEIDDDGVEAQKITLIDQGILKTLCTNRVPTRSIKQSNGHCKGGVAATSNLFISSENRLSGEALKQRLIELGKEDGLQEVYIIRKLLTRPAEFNADLLQSIMRSIVSSGSDGMLFPPVLIYKVSTADGHEELCRGATFSGLSLRVLRDIDATGDDARAYPVVGRANGVTSIVAPSIVVKEIEIQRPERANSKGPILKNPYFDK